MALQSAGNTHRDLGLPTRHAARTPLESRRRTSRRPFLELLEDRLAPAVLAELDGGLTLSIVLNQHNEQLTLQSVNGTLYDLNSTAAITGSVTSGRVSFDVGGPTHAQV